MLIDQEEQSYPYADARLTGSVAAELILSLFRGQVVDSKELVPRVKEYHRANGGVPLATNENSIRKKALSLLVSAGQATKVGHARYRFSDDPESVLAVKAPPSEPRSDTFSEPEFELQAERWLGEGDQVVYAYCFPTYQSLAAAESRTTWPIKIGMSAIGLSRVVEQVGTALPETPKVLLAIKTDDARTLEKAFHCCLQVANRQIEEALGSEWYDTNIDQIMLLYETMLSLESEVD